MKTKLIRSLQNIAIVAAILAGLSSSASASTLYWWGAGTSYGGTGTWNTATAGQWSTSSSSNTAGSWNQAGGEDIARFGGSTSVANVSGTVNVNQIISDFGTTIQGGTLNLTSATPTFTIGNLITVNLGISSATTLTGSNGFTVTGAGGILDVRRNIGNGISGTVTVNTGAELRANANDALGTNLDLNVIGTGAFNVNQNTAVAFKSLAGNGNVGLIFAGSNSTLTLSSNNVSASTFTGRIRPNTTTKINLIKSGSYEQVLGGTTSNDGLNNVSISGGVLAFNKTAGVDAISSGAVTVSSGTLRLDASNQINNSVTMTLSGGTFNLQGNSETLGALILFNSTTSFLDFGTGSSTLLFAGITADSGILSITGWTAAQDSLRFTSNVNLSASSFTINGGAASIVDQGGYFEVIPEPGTTALIALGVGVLAACSKRRRRA